MSQPFLFALPENPVYTGVFSVAEQIRAKTEAYAIERGEDPGLLTDLCAVSSAAFCQSLHRRGLPGMVVEGYFLDRRQKQVVTHVWVYVRINGHEDYIDITRTQFQPDKPRVSVIRPGSLPYLPERFWVDVPAIYQETKWLVKQRKIVDLLSV